MPSRKEGDILPSKLPKFTLRVPEVLLRKTDYIAEANGRSANREIEMLIRRHIAEFEKQHGEIDIIEELEVAGLNNAQKLSGQAKAQDQFNFKTEPDKVAQMLYYYQRLRGLREERGLTQEELCKEIDGLTLDMLRKYEAGTLEISPDHQVELAVFFKVSRTFIMGLTNQRTKKRANVNFEAMGRDKPVETPLSPQERKALNDMKRSQGYYVEDDES